MPSSWPTHELPKLTSQNWEIKSRASRRYNCIAWAAREDFRWWWPDPLQAYYWPPGIPRAETFDAFIRAYGTLGFNLCFDGKLEQGIEKIALFGRGESGAEIPTHAALQLESGLWTSKIGVFEDISHATVDAVDGPAYGKVICYLSRPRPKERIPFASG